LWFSDNLYSPDSKKGGTHRLRRYFGLSDADYFDGEE